MCNNVNNSQSTAAVNSAKTSFSFYSKKNDSPRTNYEIDWQDHTIAGVAREALTAYGVDAKMEVYDDGYIFDLAVKRIDGKYYVGVIVWNRDATKVLVQKCVPTMYSRMTKKAISEFATDIWEMYDYAWDMIKAAEISNKISANVEAEVSEAPCLEQAPCLDEKKILEDFCTNEASKIMYAGLTSVALTNNEEFYMYDYESLYDYLVDAGFDADRAYEIRGQYESEVDRAIRGLLTAPDFVPVEVSDSDIESTERFWDDITFPYSAKGLAYVKENTSEVYMDDIIKEVAEFHWDFESVVKESRWTRFTNNSFRELIWSTCWAEYLVAHTDEALEAETRYVMDFDSVYDDLFGDLWPYMTSYDDSCGGCELWVDSWYAVERAAEIIEESVADSDTRCIDWDEFPDYMMTAFLGDLYGFETFTERVMSELEGGDIVDILPYDDGLYLSFVNDEAEVAA